MALPMDLIAAISAIAASTYLIYRAVRSMDERDLRADAWRRNHAHPRRWWE